MPLRAIHNSIVVAAVALAAITLTPAVQASTGELLLEGCRLLQRGLYTRAAAQFAAVSQQDAQCAEALVGEGLACLNQGQVAEALVHFQTAATLSSGSRLAYWGVGAVLCQRGDYADARAVYQHLLSLGPPVSAEVSGRDIQTLLASRN